MNYQDSLSLNTVFWVFLTLVNTLLGYQIGYFEYLLFDIIYIILCLNFRPNSNLFLYLKK